jgi:AcrR family transcriptional regulator
MFYLEWNECMGVAERKQREKDARVEAIQKVARRLIAKKGLGNTTMSEIAQGAELGKGTIYLFFKSKEDLYYSLMVPILEDFNGQLRKVTRNEKEMADRTLMKLGDFFLNSYLKEPEPYQVVMYYRAAETQPALSPERIEHLRNLMRTNLREVERIIERGIEQRVFRDVNPKSTSISIWNMVIGNLQFEENRTYDRRKSHLESLLLDSIKMILYGLKV